MSTEFVVARSLDEAFDALTDDEAVVIAGGVAVGLLSNMGMVSTARLVAISRIPELQGVQIDQDMLSI
jgi:CO/xanthine dehydrogenase FAD-binding subunit